MLQNNVHEKSVIQFPAKRPKSADIISNFVSRESIIIYRIKGPKSFWQKLTFPFIIVAEENISMRTCFYALREVSKV